MGTVLTSVRLIWCVVVSKENIQHSLSFAVEAPQSLLQHQQSCQQLLAGTHTMKMYVENLKDISKKKVNFT